MKILKIGNFLIEFVFIVLLSIFVCVAYFECICASESCYGCVNEDVSVVERVVFCFINYFATCYTDDAHLFVPAT